MNTPQTPTIETYGELELAFDVFNEHLFDKQLPECLLTLQREKATFGYFSANRFGNRAGKTVDEIALNPTYFAVVPLVETMQTIVHEMCHLWQFHFGTPGRSRYHNAEWGKKMQSIGLMPSSTGRPGGATTGDKMADYPIEGGRFLKVCNERLFTRAFKISWYDRFPPPAVIEVAMLTQAGATSALTGLPPEAAVAAIQLPGGSLGSEDAPSSTVAFAPLGTDSLRPPGLVIPPIQQAKSKTKYSCACSPNLNLWGKPGLLVRCELCGELFEGSGEQRNSQPT